MKSQVSEVHRYVKVGKLAHTLPPGIGDWILAKSSGQYRAGTQKNDETVNPCTHLAVDSSCPFTVVQLLLLSCGLFTTKKVRCVPGGFCCILRRNVVPQPPLSRRICLAGKTHASIRRCLQPKTQPKCVKSQLKMRNI